MDEYSEGSQIKALERKYWQGMKDHDTETLLELTDFPCLVAGRQGARLVDKETYLKMFESREGVILDFEFTGEPEVRMLAPDLAVIAYEIRSKFRTGGEEKTIVAVDSSTWVRRNGRWACAMHSETEKQDPQVNENAA